MAYPPKPASRQPRSVIYRLSGPFTVDTAPRVLKRLQELYHPTLRVISLDFTEVREVDSSALATMLWSLHYSAQHEIQINIIGSSAKLSALMELYQVEKLLRLSHS